MTKYLFVALFLVTTFQSQALRIAPTELEGYTYLPNGPITFAELEEYDYSQVKDLKNNGIVGLEKAGFSIQIKEKGKKAFRHFMYINTYEETDARHAFDSLSQTVHLDDTFAIKAYFKRTTDYKGEGSWNYMFQTFTKYAVKTETIAALLRKGEDLMTVYPNPCRTETSIKLDVSEELTATYFILDGFGRKIQEGKLQDIRLEILIDLKDEPSGTFIFYITIDTEIFSKKIIKLE